MEFNLKKVPVNKYFKENQPIANIFHADLGTYESTKATLEGVKSVSYNYYIRRGVDEIVEFVPQKYGAWHAGVVHKPTKRAKDVFGSRNPNKYSVGICFESKPVDARGVVTYDWSKVVDGQKATDQQVRLAKHLLLHLGTGKLPNFAHREITSYKPKCVLDFVQRLEKELAESKHDGACDLSVFTTQQLISEILGRF